MAAAKNKAQVIRAYTDRVDGKVHLKGEEVELSADRLDELKEGGFVEPVTPKTSSRTKKGN